MTVLFATGFGMAPLEWCPLTWTGKTGGAQSTVQTGTIISGSASLKLDCTTTGGTDAHCAATSDTYYPDMMFHFNFRVTAVPAASSSEIIVISLQDGNSIAAGARSFFRMNITRNAGGTAPMLRFRICPGGPNDANALARDFDIAVNTTYSAQIRLVVPATGVTADIAQWAFAEVKIDDVIRYRQWGRELSMGLDSKVNVQLGQAFNALETYPAADVYIDDFMMSTATGTYNNKWPGNALTVEDLAPTGVGTNLTYDAWGAVGAASPNQYQNIDDAPEAANRIFSSAAGQKTSWNLSNMSGGGTIRCVTLCNQTDQPSAGTAQAVVRPILWDTEPGTDLEVAGTSYTVNNVSGNANVGNAAGLRGRCWVYERTPSAAAAWTSTIINALEGGMECVSKGTSNPFVTDARVYVLEGTEGAEAPRPMPPGAMPGGIAI